MYLKKSDIIEKIFYIIIAVYFLLSGMTMTMIEDVKIISLFAKLGRYACYIAFLFIITCNVVDFRKKLTLKGIFLDFFNYFKKHIILVLVLCNTILILFSAKSRAPLILVLLIWACSFYDFKKIIKLYLSVMFGFMLFTWATSLFKIVPEIIITRAERQRFSLGFIYPLETMTFFLFLVICYVYIKAKKFNIKDFLLIQVVAYLLYALTDARTSYFLVVGVSLVALIYAKTKIEVLLEKISPKFCYMMVAVLILSILGCGYFYNKDNAILSKLNDLLSTRLELMYQAFQSYGLSLFGEKIKWVGFGGQSDPALVEKIYNFVDCGYAKMLLDYGIVFSIFVCVGYALMYQYALEKKDYILILAVTMVLLVSIMEPRIVSIEMNPFVLLLGFLFMKENKSNFKFIK